MPARTPSTGSPHLHRRVRVRVRVRSIFEVDEAEYVVRFTVIVAVPVSVRVTVKAVGS